MLIYAVAFAVAGATPFILLPVLTKMLTPTEFGKATSFLILAVMIGNFAGLSAHGFVAVRYFKSQAAGFRGVVSTSVLYVCGAHALVLALIPALFPWLADWFGLPASMVLLAVIAALLISLNQIFLAIYQSSGKPMLYLLARSAQALVEIALCVGLLLAVAAESGSRIFSYVIALAASAFIGLRHCRQQGYLGSAMNRTDARSLRAFAVPMIPHILAGTAITYIDRVMVSSILGVDSLGVYMVGMQIGMAMSVLIEPMNKALAPWLFGELAKKDPQVDRRVVRSTYLFYAGLVVAGFIVALVSHRLFDFIIASEYADAKALIPWLVAGFVFQGMYYTVVNYIFYAERTGRLSAMSTGTAVFGALLSYVLISRMGMAGAGISFAITNFSLFALAWFTASRLVPMPWLLR